LVGQLRLRLRLRLRVGVCVCVRLCARARLCRGGPGWASRAPAFRCRLAARPASGRPPSPRPYRPRRRPPPRAANLPPTNRRTSPPPPPRPRRRRWGVGGGPSRGIIAVPPGCRAAKAARMARGQPLASRGGGPGVCQDAGGGDGSGPKRAFGAPDGACCVRRKGRDGTCEAAKRRRLWFWRRRRVLAGQRAGGRRPQRGGIMGRGRRL
jgi:hypothetical protein